MGAAIGARPPPYGDRSLVAVLVGDGRPLLAAVALGLAASGGFAVFLGLTGQFLPHDEAWLGVDASRLGGMAGDRLVGFMVHDRVAFGGTLIAVAIVWLWLVAGPLGEGSRWAWWAVAVSAAAGFASFLGYLGYGYLDTWHATGSLALLPPTLVGLWLTRQTLGPRTPAALRSLEPLGRVGRGLILLTSFGMVVAGLTIVTIGSVVVFVPQDLAFMGHDRDALHELNPRLVPLIAHDRVGFGGAVASTGLAVLVAATFSPPTRAFRDAIALAGTAGFGAAIGIHLLVGYTDLTHLGPAVLAALILAAGVVLESLSATRRSRPPAPRA